MNVPALTTTTAQPSILESPRQIVGLLDRLLSGHERHGSEIALERLPSAQERTMLQDRYRELRKVLRVVKESTAEQERAAQAIAAMLTNWSLHATMRGVSPHDACANFVTHLIELPLFAIVEACERKRTGNDPHPPSCGEVRTIAVAAWERVRAEGDRIVSVINCSRAIVQQVSPAERARVSEQLGALAKTLNVTEELDAAMASRVRGRARTSSNDSILREYQKLGIEPQYNSLGPISPSLLRSISRLPLPKKRKK